MGATVNVTASSGMGTTKPRKRVIVATVAGNWLEFFDFTTFALFAVWIGRTFFPSESPQTQLLLAVGAFGAGYLMRPLGAVVLGRYADVHGRRAALMATILLMALGTAIIAFTPSYDAIGIAAPVLIVSARLIQGFSAGGEMGAATSYLIESAPPGRRATRGSWQYASQGLATLAASLMAFALSLGLSADQMAAWGWRVPFVFGLLIAPVGLIIRRYMHDDAPAPAREARTRSQYWSVLAQNRGLLLTGLMCFWGTAVAASIIGHYMTSYAIRTLGVPASRPPDRPGAPASSGSGCNTCHLNDMTMKRPNRCLRANCRTRLAAEDRLICPRLEGGAFKLAVALRGTPLMRGASQGTTCAAKGTWYGL